MNTERLQNGVEENQRCKKENSKIKLKRKMYIEKTKIPGHDSNGGIVREQNKFYSAQ